MAVSREVNLVIRAKDQAKAAIVSITNALQSLSTTQQSVAASGDATGGALGRLGTALSALQARAQGLNAFSVVTAQVDKAQAAVARLEAAVARSSATLQTAGAGAQSAAERIAIATTALAKAQNDIRVSEGSIRLARDTGIGSSALPDQQALLARQRAALAATKAELKAATVDQAAFGLSVERASDSLQRETVSLERARIELAEIQATAGRASAAMGGVASSQVAVGEAAEQTAADIQRINDALARQQTVAAFREQGAGAAQATAAFRAQVSAVQQTEAAWNSARAEVTRLAGAIRSAEAPTEALQQEFRNAVSASRQAKDAFLAQRNALQALRQQERGGGFAAFDQRASAIQGEVAAASRAREAAIQREVVATNQARVAQEAYNRSLLGMIRNLLGLRAPAAQARAAVQSVTQAVRQADAATRATQVLATRQGRPFLGLRPFELQNLSFQINDVFTQLASGTSITQTFAQQAGQIAQIFPRAIAAILRFLPAIAAAAVAVTAFAQAFGRVAGLEASGRRFNRILAVTADGARTSGEQLALAARQIGGSVKDAEASIRAFLQEGVSESRFVQLGEAARKMAEVLGIEVPEAAERAARAFTEDFEAVDELDEALNFLTASERQHIRQLFESGREAQARAEALRIFTRQMDASADRAQGSWSEAFSAAGDAWNGMVDAIANSGFVEVVGRKFGELGGFVRDFVKELSFFTTFLFQGEQAALALESSTGRRPDVGAQGVEDPRADNDRNRNEERRRAEAEARRGEEESAREAEAAVDRAAAFRQSLEDQNDLRAFELSLIGQTAEEAEVLRAIYDATLAARQAGVTLSQEELDNIRLSIEAVQERQQAEAEAAATAEEHRVAQREAQRAAEEAAEEAAQAVERGNERLASTLTDAVDAIGRGDDAFREFAANFLRRIALMIIQQQILNALQGASASNPYAAAARAVVGALHSGGIAGSARPGRAIDPSWFAGARRFHNGGMAGLRRDEVPAILKRNEEVLTANDPRHAFNGGGQPQRAQDVTINNLIDSGEFVAKGLTTREGEQGLMNFITANRTSIRSALS